jgi:hypothetical protein
MPISGLITIPITGRVIRDAVIHHPAIRVGRSYPFECL